MFFNNLAKASSAFNLPDDFAGPFTRAELQKASDEETTAQSFENVANILYEIGDYIYNKYTYEEISQEDFIEKLRIFFPEDDEDQLQNKQKYLQIGYIAYNKTKEAYSKIISYKLVPEKLRKVKSDDEYDHLNEVPYMEAPTGKFYVVNNFKKFLTYSHLPKEKQAIAAYEERKNSRSNIIDKIDIILQKIEWKKLLLYGYKYKNPFLTDLGTTKWQEYSNLSIRTLSPSTYIDNADQLDFGIQIITKPDTFILANNLSTIYQKPQIDLSPSENISDLKITLPTPSNSTTHPEAHKYFGDILIPFKVKPLDKTKPITLKGQIKLTSCDNSLNCTPQTFQLEQTLEPAGDDFFTNGYENYFFTNISSLPKEQSKYITLTDISVDNTFDKQIIRLQFTAHKKIKSFKVFLEEVNGFTRFNSPYIRLHDNKIYVNFEPIDEDQKNNLINSKFIITATLNNSYHYRTIRTATPISDFNPEKGFLNWGIIFFAFLGGLILNFMPCVFPVLSLKILTFSHAEAKYRLQMKKSFFATVIGIFTGFTILIIGLILAKFMGYSLGWGMQFQNMGFLIAMTFILSCFIILAPSINFNSLYNNSTHNNKTSFLIGTLIVLLSTPCTGPYLATAIGFALTGTYLELIAILYAVAIGLSVPYLLILVTKEPEKLFPKPGKWINILHTITQIMLYLTILWFFSLILGQTDWKCVLKIAGLLLLFIWTFLLYHKFQEYLNGILDESISESILHKIKISSHLFITALFLIMTIYCSNIAQKSYNLNYERNMINRLTKINKAEITEKLNNGHSVLLEIGADWCITCHVNKYAIFNHTNLNYWKKAYNLDFIHIDWTNYNKEILDYMEKYGRKGIPFYILYTPFIKEGIVLPELFGLEDLQNLIYNSNQL